MKEIWKAVVGYEGRYEVSNTGLVRSLPLLVSPKGARPHVHHASGRVLTQSTNKRGYKILQLAGGKLGDGVTMRVHRLVCEAFHGPAPFAKAEVLHGDGDPANNLVSNLRWGSHKENAQDALIHGAIKVGQHHPRARLSDADVAAMREDLKTLSLRQAGDKYGVCRDYAFKIKHRMVRA